MALIRTLQEPEKMKMKHINNSDYCNSLPEAKGESASLIIQMVTVISADLLPR